MKLTLRLRPTCPYPDSTGMLVWLIENAEGVSQGLMYGNVSTATAERLAEAFENAGVKVDRGEPIGPSEDKDCTPEAKAQRQGELFKETT